MISIAFVLSLSFFHYHLVKLLLPEIGSWMFTGWEKGLNCGFSLLDRYICSYGQIQGWICSNVFLCLIESAFKVQNKTDGWLESISLFFNDYFLLVSSFTIKQNSGKWQWHSESFFHKKNLHKSNKHEAI